MDKKRFRPPAYRNPPTYTPAAWDARSAILIGAAVADLRETVFRQQCLIEALLMTLTEHGLVDDDAIHRQAEALFSVIEPVNEP